GSGTVDYATGAFGTDQATAGAACTAGVDYISKSGTLTFNNNNSQTVSVTVCGDTAAEPDETFALNLSNPTPSGGNGMTIADGQGVGTIFDNAAPTVESIVRAAASPTNAASVSWTVTFSNNVT